MNNGVGGADNCLCSSISFVHLIHDLFNCILESAATNVVQWWPWLGLLVRGLLAGMSNLEYTARMHQIASHAV